MELKDFIKTFDNALDPKIVGSLIKYLNKIKFKPTTIIGSEKGGPTVDKDIRNTDCWSFTHNPINDTSYSNVHWTNFLSGLFIECFRQYKSVYKTEIYCTKVSTIDALKYEEGGFYTPHHDHHSSAPRTLSMILFLNNDYEGGEVTFYNPTKELTKVMSVSPKPGRVIVWPSNFLYPHSVEKVTKGKRYTVVSWLL
jgi:hypothetical protein